MRILLLLFFCLLLSLHNFSQAFTEKYINAEAIGINKGLSQGMINCIAQDHIGFMWFGTMDGLNRYDGYKFQVFRNDPSDTKSVSGNFITAIFQDSKRRLWVGTALHGLNLFLPEKEAFIHFTTGTKPALSNNTVLSIQEDKYGSIWIATQCGLNKLTIEDTYEANNHQPGMNPAPEASPSVQIKRVSLNGVSGKELFTSDYPAEPCFLVSKSGFIWASGSGHVFKIAPSRSGADSIIKEEAYLYRQKENGIYADIVKITEDTMANLLCFKGRKFFTVVDGKSGQFTYWNCAPFDVNTGRNQVVWENGIVWERALRGLFCFDVLQKKILRVKSYNTELDKLLQSPFSIYKDRAGIIWIGTGGYGLLKYNPRTEAFHSVLGKSIVWMTPTPKGNVLLVGNGELQYFKKDSGGRNSLFRQDTLFNGKLRRFTKESPYMAVQDKEGTFWLALNNVTKFNIEKRSFNTLKIPTNAIFPFFLDNRDRLWYATSDSFCVLNKITNHSSSYGFPVKGAAGSPYKLCETITQDIKGIFWLGTTEGLLSFNEATQRWQQYKNIPGDRTSISNNIVFSVCDDPESPGEYIWVGTNGGGLNRLCVKTGKFDHIGLAEGLPNMVVYGILADEDKQLWMSTNNGIASLQLKYSYYENNQPGTISQKKFKYYFEENGLQGDEFNRYAFCKTADGTMFFGGVNGFNYFSPRQVSKNNVIPNVVITNFTISNRKVTFEKGVSHGKGGEKQLLTKPVYLTGNIELPYSANIFSFEFASLDFTSSEKNMYRHKLENFDKEWVQSGNNNSATYTNLDPGEYTFTVTGSNSDGLWNEKGASIRITIIPHWYMTWWFRVTLVLVTVLALFALFRFLLAQKLKLHKIRNHIARDLHDEIGSTLSSVYIYSEIAQRVTNNTATQTNAYLKQIGTDAANMIEALGDIIWTVNTKNDRFENIINRMRASSIELFEAKGCELHLQFENELNFLNLGMDKRKNFYLIYKEAINNAAKYSGAKNVWINLTYQKPYIQLSVKDDGKGFAFDDKTTGNGLANMQRRAVELKGKIEIISSVGTGTLIQLTFPV